MVQSNCNYIEYFNIHNRYIIYSGMKMKEQLISTEFNILYIQLTIILVALFDKLWSNSSYSFFFISVVALLATSWKCRGTWDIIKGLVLWLLLSLWSNHLTLIWEGYGVRKIFKLCTKYIFFFFSFFWCMK